MHPLHAFHRLAAGLAVLLLVAACARGAERPVAEQAADTVAAPADLEPADTMQLPPEAMAMAPGPFIHCPGGSDRTARATVGAGGGTITHPAGHALRIGAGVVQQPTEFLLRELPGERMQVQARPTSGPRVEGEIELTIDYSRCPREEVEGRQLRVFRVRESAEPEDLDGEMIGNDRIRARVGRLSVFAVGF